jgi:hypothetical protein
MAARPDLFIIPPREEQKLIWALVREIHHERSRFIDVGLGRIELILRVTPRLKMLDFRRKQHGPLYASPSVNLKWTLTGTLVLRSARQMNSRGQVAQSRQGLVAGIEVDQAN